MPQPFAAAAWGLLAASSLIVGAWIGVSMRINRRTVALVMGFGAGALISALAFDLTEEAFRGGGGLPTALGLAGGALTYFVGDLILQRRQARMASNATARVNGPKTARLAIVLGALLDGLPESFVLGATLLGGQGISISLLAAIFLSNVPEGVAGGRDLLDEGRPRDWIMRLWIGVVLASAVAAGLGNAVLATASPETVAITQAFAAGAILTMLADTMMPEAFENGGDGVGLATVLGFALAFFLGNAQG
jgi:zinc transporter, ZIP family